MVKVIDDELTFRADRLIIIINEDAGRLDYSLK